jgi:hypothetical protein
MLYYNPRYTFPPIGKAPQDKIYGGIINTVAMPHPQLIRRQFKEHPYLKRRLLDPQLYLCGLDANNAQKAVANLASFPWFPTASDVPEYKTADYQGRAKGQGGVRGWLKDHEQQLRDSWLKRCPTETREIEEAITACVMMQMALGCEAIILPAPLTNVQTSDYGVELEWLDRGLQICKKFNVEGLPVYASVTLADNVLRGIEPDQNVLLSTITDQITSRDVAGAYLVVIQGGETRYVCRDPDTLGSVLTFVDDLVRGARKKVIVNYMGTFGAVALGAGASIWATGYYMTQRRMKFDDMEIDEARARPRYYSIQLAGDIGLQKDLDKIQEAGLLKEVIYDSNAAKPLHRALLDKKPASAATEWDYQPSRIQAAASHYLDLIQNFAYRLQLMSPERRPEAVLKWLRKTVATAELISTRAGVSDSQYTELSHQVTWLREFTKWKTKAEAQ